MIELILLFCIKVVLTVDDAPNKYTMEIAQAIKTNYRGECRFYVIGSQLKGQDKTIEFLIDSGFDIGNHTFNHSSLTNFTSINSYIYELKQVHNYILNKHNYEIEYFRPPYGRMNNITIMGLEEMNYKLEGWNANINDDVIKLKKNDLSNLISRQVRNNRVIILIHSTYSVAKNINKLLFAIKELK